MCLFIWLLFNRLSFDSVFCAQSWPLPQVNLKLFSPEPNRRRTVLLFVIRDKSKTPLEKLVEILSEDVHKMWDTISKPPQYESSRIDDFFEVMIWHCCEKCRFSVCQHAAACDDASGGGLVVGHVPVLGGRTVPVLQQPWLPPMMLEMHGQFSAQAPECSTGVYRGQQGSTSTATTCIMLCLLMLSGPIHRTSPL
jgi:hypothetical protein